MQLCHTVSMLQTVLDSTFRRLVLLPSNRFRILGLPFALDTFNDIPNWPLPLLFPDQALSRGECWPIERHALQHLLDFLQVERFILDQSLCELAVSLASRAGVIRGRPCYLPCAIAARCPSEAFSCAPYSHPGSL